MYANISVLGRIDTNAWKEMVNMNFNVWENDRGDERRKDHRPCRKIEIGRPISNQKYNFSVQN